MARIASLLALASALALLGAGLAEAAPRVRPEGSKRVATVESLAQGPQLVAGRVAWLDSSSRCIGECRDVASDFTEATRYSLRVSRPRRRPRVLYTSRSSSGTLGGTADTFGGGFEFALSRTFLATEATKEFEGREYSSFGLRLTAGPRPRSPRRAKLARVAGCSAEGIAGESSGFVLSGALLVYDDTPCSRRTPDRFSLRDLSTGRTRSEVLPGSVAIADLAAAGSFVAVSLYAYDRSTRQTTYSIGVFRRDREGAIAVVPVGASHPSIDLQRDGRVAICTDDGRLATFSASDPQLRELGSCEGSVRIASDRIVSRARVRGRAAGLQVSDLAGRRVTLAALGRIDLHGFDFDGRAVAYALDRCDGGTEILRSPASARDRRRLFVKCPAFIRTRRVLGVRAGGRTRFALGCPRGCAGYFELVGGRYVIASGSFERGRGRSTVNVRLARYGRRALARHGGRLRVKLKLTLDDRDAGRSSVSRRLRLTR